MFNFLVTVVIEILSRYDIYIYIYIIPEKKDFMATFESFFMFFVIFLTLTLAIRCQDADFLFQVGKP